MDHRKAFNTARPSNSIPSAGQSPIEIDGIVDVIFSFSTPRTIIALSQTCRAVYLIAASYFRAAYNPERWLHQFFPDPPDVRAFRSLQAETGVVAYGKTVRNFLARAPFTDTEMGLFVDGSYAPRVNEFLTGAGYDVETSQESVFTRKEKDGQVVRRIVLLRNHRRNGKCKPSARIYKFPSGLTDVLTFDGAYSLFPAQYDKPNIENPLDPAEIPQPIPQPIYRSFSDRSSWVVSFDETNVVPSRLAFGVSAPVRDPLYTSSCMLAWPRQTLFPEPPDAVIRLHAVLLRSPQLKFAHVICCPRLGDYVQLFLTRLVLAYPERAKLRFDAEVAQFLRVLFERADIHEGIAASYFTVWAIMKEMVPLPSDTPRVGGPQWPRQAPQSPSEICSSPWSS